MESVAVVREPGAGMEECMEARVAMGMVEGYSVGSRVGAFSAEMRVVEAALTVEAFSVEMREAEERLEGKVEWEAKQGLAFRAARREVKSECFQQTPDACLHRRQAAIP